MNSNFEGENNAYLIQDDQVVLVDTGIATGETRHQLRSGLNQYGISFKDIDEIFLTHYHSDHAGLAGEIQQISGASVFAHRLDVELLERTDNVWNGLKDQYTSLFEQWGVPQDKIDQLVTYRENRPRRYSGDLNVEAFSDGDRFDLGNTELEILHTPGHTLGLSSLRMLDQNEVFTGDALLPVYTPNIGGADIRVKNPLKQYLDSLQRIIELDFRRAWPGHRYPIENPSARARTVIEHHEERTWKVVQILNQIELPDVWTVGSHLFGDLENMHILHGSGEAYAHLDYLVNVGDAEQINDGYRLTGDARERFEVCETKSWSL